MVLIVHVCNIVLARAIDATFVLEDALAVSRVLTRDDAPDVLPALLARNFPQLSPYSVARNTANKSLVRRYFSRTQLKESIYSLCALYCEMGDLDSVDWATATFPTLKPADLVKQVATYAATKGDIAALDAISDRYPGLLVPNSSLFTTAAKNGNLELIKWLMALVPNPAGPDFHNLLRYVPSEASGAEHAHILEWWWSVVDGHMELEGARTFFCIQNMVVTRLPSVAMFDWWKAHPLWTWPTGYSRFTLFITALAKDRMDVADRWMAELADEAPLPWLLHSSQPGNVGTQPHYAALEIITGAARRGAIPVLEWMWDRTRSLDHAQKLNWTMVGRELLAAASEKNQISVLDWWIAKCKTPPKCSFRRSFHAIVLASEMGHLDTLAWWLAHTQHMCWGSKGAVQKAITEATLQGHVPVLRWWQQLMADGRAPHCTPFTYLSGKTEQVDVLHYWWSNAADKEQLMTAWLLELPGLVGERFLPPIVKTCWSLMLTLDSSAALETQVVDMWNSVIINAKGVCHLDTLVWWEAEVLEHPAFPKAQFMKTLSYQQALKAAIQSGKILVVHFWIAFALRHRLDLVLEPHMTTLTRHGSNSLLVLELLYKWHQITASKQTDTTPFERRQPWFLIIDRYIGNAFGWLVEMHLADELQIVCEGWGVPNTSWGTDQWWDAQEKHGCTFWVNRGNAEEGPRLVRFWFVKLAGTVTMVES
ncbi:hypothetical protein BC828DRAFT_390902 [Blastocladiella britannica]|nr:hypothetical protein BC828DRAFT_390902 [Blastocladiella britannica]